MSVQPQDSHENPRSGNSQGSQATRREIYEQPQTVRETYHLATLNGCDVENPRLPVKAVGRE